MLRRFRKSAVRSALLPVLLLPLQLAAAAEQQAPVLRPPPGTPDVLSVATSLVLVVGAIFLVGWLYSRTQRLRGSAGGDIRIVAAQALGTKERIVVVQLAGKQLVVGVTPSSINTLHVFDDEVIEGAAPAMGRAFAGRLRAALGSKS